MLLCDDESKDRWKIVAATGGGHDTQQTSCAKFIMRIVFDVHPTGMAAPEIFSLSSNVSVMFGIM